MAEDRAKSTPDRTRVPVFYVAHPVGGDVANNLARARRWFAFLVEREPDVAFSIPWMTYVEVLEESVPANRLRGLRDDVAMVGKCDGIVLCGGRVSNGMQLELDAAIAAGLTVVDLVDLGEDPSDIPDLPDGPIAWGRRAWVAREITEGQRWKAIAKKLGDRVRALEVQLIEAGMCELRDATAETPARGIPAFDVGGES